MERITARSNEKIKSAANIRDSAKARREQGKFFLEGARLCSDAAENGVKIEKAFISAQAMIKYPQYVSAILSKCCESFEIGDEVVSRLSDTQSPQGIFCVCCFDEKEADADKINPRGKYIFLENVQDPSNLGAISRTAEALGIDGVIVSGGCDIYNPKALRASMGSALRINIMSCDNSEKLLTKIRKSGMLTLASTPDTDSVRIDSLKISGGVVCVVGNEGNGVTPETMKLCEKKVTIPMAGRAESLNASTAAAILIWEMVKNGR